MRVMTSVEAQNHFGELLDAAQREPVTITRRGRVAGFMVSEQDMAELLEIRRQRSKAVAAFESCFAKTDSKLNPEAKSLTDDSINRMVHGLR